jgi:hypothetical protein
MTCKVKGKQANKRERESKREREEIFKRKKGLSWSEYIALLLT